MRSSAVRKPDPPSRAVASSELARAGLVVRAALALARATEQAVACCPVAHELCQLAGTSAVAVYLLGGEPEGELRLAAHAGDGRREGWSSQLTFPRRAARAGRPTPATRVDRHQFASIGVTSRSVVAVPLACREDNSARSQAQRAATRGLAGGSQPV
jgi:hypothetical protein